MKLEVGMYLRHEGLEGEYPIIQKITELKTPGRCGGKYKVYTDKCEDWFIDSDYIELHKSKYSHNIIDLIEEGDYVNGKQVTKINLDYIFDYSEEIKMIYFSDNDYIYSTADIKSIVTKEQMESMSYKVEG